MEGKTVAKVTKKNVTEPGPWGEIYDSLTIQFTDGTKATYRSQFCGQNHTEIFKEDNP